MSTKKAKYTAPALEKGLDIIEHLAQCTAPQTQADLVKALGRTQSELYRMLECLRQRDYISRDPNTGAYRLTLKLYALGHRQDRVAMLRRAATPAMEELAETVGTSCHLSLEHAGELLVIIERLPARQICLAVGEGRMLPLVGSTSGAWFLSRLKTDGQRLELLNEYEPFQSLSATKKRLFLRQLKTMADEEAAIRASSTTPGGVDIATSVGLPGTDLFAVLAMPYVEGNTNRSLRKRRAEALRWCAEKIDTNLGVRIQ